MKEKTMDLIVVIVSICMLILGVIALIFLAKPEKETSTIYKYIVPETGVGYLITDNGFICPIYNPDGTLYTELTNDK